MRHRLASLATTLLCCVPVAVAADAVELRYTGSLEQVAGEGLGNTKSFEVYCVLRPQASGGHELFWLVEEQGGGGWAWPERFGRLELDKTHTATGGRPVRVLHTHDGLQHPVELPQPLFEFSSKLSDGNTWTAGKREFSVSGPKNRGELRCWQVDVVINPGRRQTVFVDSQTQRIVALQERVFMGRGDRYELTMNLKTASALDTGKSDRVADVFTSLVDLQKNLKRRDTETSTTLHEEQLQTAAGVLDSLEKAVQSTPLETFVTAVSKDVGQQQQRDTGLAGLAGKFVGKPAPEFTLKALDGKDVALKSLLEDGKVVVLHFWKYHDDKLTEPYGQVGYLEFLRNKRNKLGVAVFGVAVDGRFGDATDKTTARREVNKLVEFMNLSYPVLLDDGAVLKKYGEPQKFGGNLPLWVVITPGGEVAHYKVGYYQVDPNRGLEQLDAVLVELIRKQRGE